MSSTLVISDTHFDKRIDKKKITAIINLIDQSDRVILLGDFWDHLHITADEFLKLEHLQPLFEVLKSKGCIYLYGNHDPLIEEDFSKFTVFCDEVKYVHDEKIGEKTYHFEHGDLLVKKNDGFFIGIVDFIANKIFGRSLFSRIVNIIFSIIKRFTKGKNPFGKIWNEAILQEVKNNEEYHGKVLVCGHTHYQHDYQSYINIGANLDRYMQYMIINENGHNLFNVKI